MSSKTTMNFKVEALTTERLRANAPSVFAEGPMRGVSGRYTFVPTADIVRGLQEMEWVPVGVEEQRIRIEARRGFQKHLVRFRQSAQIATLDEWNVELVLVNSHDAGSAYQLHAGVFRRLCSNGLVISEGGFEALRFRHAGLTAAAVVEASLRLLAEIPRLGGLIERFRRRTLTDPEGVRFAEAALLLRYPSLPEAPVSPEALLRVRRQEDEGSDLWRTLNRVQEHLVRGGIADGKRDRRGRTRSVRALRGIDSKVDLNKGLWSLAESLERGEAPGQNGTVVVSG